MAIVNLARNKSGCYVLSRKSLRYSSGGTSQHWYDVDDENAVKICPGAFERITGFKYRRHRPIRVEITIKRVRSKP